MSSTAKTCQLKRENLTPNASWSTLSSLEDDHSEDFSFDYPIRMSNSCLLDYERICKRPVLCLLRRSVSFPSVREMITFEKKYEIEDVNLVARKD